MFQKYKGNQEAVVVPIKAEGAKDLGVAIKIAKCFFKQWVGGLFPSA